MKIIRLLIMLTAFLIMISSALILFAPHDLKTPVYINIAAMGCLVAVVTMMNFRKQQEKERHV
jgi:divalent metal cation (Fe/Co/Zn/Cd) transporter